MSANVVKFPNGHKRTFTSQEAMIDAVRESIFKDGRTYKSIAEATGVCNGTIARLASGTTRWPKPSTLFPLLDVLGYELIMQKKGNR